MVELKLSREEALACIVKLEQAKQPYRWQQSVLAKLLKAMGMKPKGR